MSYNVWASGPIIEDKLFIFAMVEGRKDTFDDFNREISDSQEESDPQALIKLDWNITDDHLLELTGIFNESDEKNVTYTNADGVYYADHHGSKNAEFNETNGGEIYIAKYTGHLTDDLTVSALLGRSTNKIDLQNPAVFDEEAAKCPRVFDSRANASQVVKIGCWNRSQTFIPDPNHPGDEDTRESIRLGAEYTIGDHSLRIGYDKETYESDFRGRTYTGGIYYRYFITPESGRIGGSTNHNLQPGDEYVRTWIRNRNSGSFEVENTAWYIEDNWQVTDDILVYLGLRNETFTNYNGEGVVFAEADDQLAPRMGFSWDIEGDSSKKLFANIGRYFIPIASNTNIRASNAEPFIIRFWEFSGGIDPNTGAPVALGNMISEAISSPENAPNPATVTDQNLKPMHQDEYILGYQQEITEDWSLGVRGIYRDIKDGMDDFCSHGGFIQWAADQGFTNFDHETLAECMIVNPGNPLTFAIDVENNGNLQVHTIPNSYFNLPKYKREYKAIELFWEKAASDGLYLQGSYTWAKSEGNAEGYVNSTLEQDDPGITQDFDHSRFMDGAYGPLPNDRRHTFKLFGNYQINEEWSTSVSLLAQSGRPVNCNGYLPLDGLHPVDAEGLSGYGNSAFYCLNEKTGKSELAPRGSQGRTPWLYNVDVGIGYTPNWAEGLTLRVDISNLLGERIVTQYDEEGDSVRDFRNANFKVPVAWQAPREVRLTARYRF